MDIKYVCGFAFADHEYFQQYPGRFLLIGKKRGPARMAGKLNGIGGKIEGDEDPFDAMVREFFEETGVLTTKADWVLSLRAHYSPEHAETSTGVGAIVYFMAAKLDRHRFDSARTTTDEAVKVLTCGGMAGYSTMTNLTYLIPMAWCHLAFPETQMLEQ